MFSNVSPNLFAPEVSPSIFENSSTSPEVSVFSESTMPSGPDSVLDVTSIFGSALAEEQSSASTPQSIFGSSEEPSIFNTPSIFSSSMDEEDCDTITGAFQSLCNKLEVEDYYNLSNLVKAVQTLYVDGV